MFDKNVEFTYADNAMCSEKRKDIVYILFILIKLVVILLNTQ